MPEENTQTRFERYEHADQLNKIVRLPIYDPIYTAIDKVCKGYSNLCFIKGRGGIGKCLLGNTKILTGDGELVNISDSPKTVLTLNLKTLDLEKSNVIGYYQRYATSYIRLETSSGRVICLTDEHPLLTKTGWKQAQVLSEGDRIAIPNEKELDEEDEDIFIDVKDRYANGILFDKIKSVKAIKDKVKVYDLCIDNYHHNFIANDIIVHNSSNIEEAFKQNKVEPVEITGEVTEAYLYRLIYENNGKPIWLRDVTAILAGLKSLNLLKSATETSGLRTLTKNNYSRLQEDLPDSFDCNSPFIFDFNSTANLSKKLRDDFEAFLSRGDYIELLISNEDIISIMKTIADTKEKKEVTKFIIDNYKAGGLFRLNLRTQYKAFQTYKYAKETHKDWKSLLLDDLTYNSANRIMLYSLIGKNKVKTANLKRLLMQYDIVQTERTAERKIKDWLFMEELFKVSSESKNYYVSLFPCNIIQ